MAWAGTTFSTYSMEQSPSWKADGLIVCYEIFDLTFIDMFNRSQLWSLISQINPVQTHINMEIHFNIILQCTSMCMYLPEGPAYPDLSTGHGWSAGNCIRSSWLWVQITVLFSVKWVENFTIYTSHFFTQHLTVLMHNRSHFSFLTFLQFTYKKCNYFTFTKYFRYEVIFSSPLKCCISLQSSTSDL
jgi:hypothetical protein